VETGLSLMKREAFIKLRVGVFEEEAGRCLEDLKEVTVWWVRGQIANLELVISNHEL
jgi:hypothetical protein